jgi:hypothetical protein
MKHLKDFIEAIVFIVTVIGVVFCIISAVVYVGQTVGAILAFLMLVGLVNYIFEKRAIK